eukprot:SAG31_NODE_445_length_15593_cov_8.514974_5_plen_128_part_00
MQCLHSATSMAQSPQQGANICPLGEQVMAEQAGDLDQADRRYHEVEQAWIEEHGKNAPPDQLLLRVRMGVVNILAEKGHATAAMQLCAEVVDAQAQTLGSGHQDTLRSDMNLAQLKADLGDLDGAHR